MGKAFFLLLCLLPQSALAPVKVSVAPFQGDEHSASLVRELKIQLRELGYVGLVEKNADVVVVVIATPIDGLSCEGYAATMFAGSARDKKSDRVSMHTAPDLQKLARHLVQKLRQEFFANAEKDARRVGRDDGPPEQTNRKP